MKTIMNVCCLPRLRIARLPDSSLLTLSLRSTMRLCPLPRWIESSSQDVVVAARDLGLLMLSAPCVLLAALCRRPSGAAQV